MSWTNSDGLRIMFGTEKGEANDTGSHAVPAIHTMEVDIDWSDITAAASHITNQTVNDAFIPAGAYIKSATIIPSTAFTSAGSATLTVGLCQADQTVIDADGIDATVAKAALAANTVVACDGALVGGTATVGANDAYVYFTTGTAAWTAGRARLIIEYVTDGQ